MKVRSRVSRAEIWAWLWMAGLMSSLMLSAATMGSDSPAWIMSVALVGVCGVGLGVVVNRHW